MSITSEQLVVEILIQAADLGIREEVIQYARHLREINIRLDRVDAYEVALSKIKEAIENE